MFELNIITTLLLLHTLLYMVGPKKSTILACGLFAFIADRATGSLKFSWDKFNHLGLDNDERGGDSIGRVVGETVDKFVSKKAKTTYQDYVINVKNSDPSHIALGHTRKASVGEISEATAQPVVLDLPDGSGRFIMIHNGTLHNWEELANKYNVETKGKSDSMVFAEIIMNYGFNVLLEYNGAAAIIIKDDREPDTLKIFKGLSKSYGNKIDEERPLCYYQESETSMYISSKCDGLYFIGGDADSVIDFDPNRLYTIFEGRIINEQIYDRSNCSQIKVWTSGAYGNTHGNFNTRGYYYGYNDDYDTNDYGQNRISNNQSSVVSLSIRKDIIYKPFNPNKIVAARLRYYFYQDSVTPMYANGIINLSEDGVRNSGNKKSGEKTYYFYRGIMMKNKDAFDKCRRALGKARHFVDSDSNVIKICEFSEYPVCTIDEQSPNWENVRMWNKNAEPGQCKAPFYTGTLTPLFSTKKYTFANGSLKNIDYLTFASTASHKEEPTKVINLPAVYSDTIIGLNKHSTDCRCKTCVDEINKIIDNHINSEAEKKEFDDYIEVPPGCSICDACNGSGDSLSTDNICPTCRGVGYVDDDDASDSSLLKAAIDEGISSILMAIDSCRNDIEISGISSPDASMAINNLSKLEDILLEVNKFRKYTLVTGYDNF